jgi:hypothetical protein
MPANGAARAEDFRRAAEEQRRARAERVVLPKSGLAMLLARPSVRWFMFHQELPTSLAARVQGAGKGFASPSGAASGGPTAEEAVTLADWVVKLVNEAVVEPRLSLNPAPNEISPDWLPQEDVDFIIKFAIGEVVGDPAAGGIAAFHRGPAGAVSAPGAGGGDFLPVAVSTAEDGPDGFSD